ncbi:MAG: tyrosine--tRNA ligase [Acidobacteria bacterium]|nr:tyrosine--tRNA ligase [Acidobacteriota bacterium]
MRVNVLDELRWRGLLYDRTEGLDAVLASGSVTAYIGFDPTASSLHVGSLLPIMSLARLQQFGHTPIALVGGGTGLIGDPSGKANERALLTLEQVEENAAGIHRQLERFLDFGPRPNAARMVNNAEWLRSLSLLEFLRDTGKHFTVNAMMARESVKRRLAAEDGLSFTEFSYQLLQAHDYLVLHDRFGCTLQAGGSDQWGNIVAGCDLIRRVRGVKTHGLVLPLVTTSAGTKFGKTEAGTIWLDAARTSPFRFYQFWLNTDDRDIVQYLKWFTVMDETHITSLAAALTAEPGKREAQRDLARTLTLAVHGAGALAKAERASAVLFGGSLAEADADDVLTVFDDVPSITVRRIDLEGAGLAAADAAVQATLVNSKGEANRLIKQGGLYVNDRRLAEGAGRITAADLIGGRVLVLRKGQRERRVVRVEG